MEKQTNLPILRFPNFSEDWEKKKLGEIEINVIDGDRGTNYPNGSDFSNKGYCLFMNAKNVTKNGFSFIENSFITKEKDDLLRNGKLERFDIVLTTRGSVGHISYYDLSVPFENLRINSGMALIRTTKKIVHSDYLYKFFNSNQIQKEIEKVSFGSAQPQLTIAEIVKFKISFPAFSEQTKIANFLTAVDDKLIQLKKKNNLLEQYKKGIMQKLFSQELRFKDENGNIFQNWEEKKLGKIVTIKSAKYNAEKEKISYKCIELEHLSSETGRLLGYVDSVNSGSIKNKFKTGDVLYGKLRPYLKKYLQTPFDGVCSSEIWVLKGKLISNDFLFRIIQTEYFNTLANQSTGSKMPRADWSVLSDANFCYPCYAEQTKIANFLSVIDDKINHCSGQIVKMESWKKGLLQKMFV